MLNNIITSRSLPDDNRKLSAIIDIIKKNPANRDLYVELAVALTGMNRFDQAIKSFHKANSLKEDFITLYNIGCLYYIKNDFKNAIISLEKSKLLNNKFHMVYLLTGLCYGRLNNFKAAESNFINVIMTDPDNATALTALSVLYYNQGKVEESLKIIKRITGLKIKADSVRKIKSEILFNSGNAAESAVEIKHFKNSSLKFKNFNDYIKSVPVSILSDKYGSIEEKIQKLENDPSKTRDNLISLSLCHLFSGNTDSAIDYLIEARGSIAI
jgi:tetratricopeptide (TPR) repeat protein